MSLLDDLNGLDLQPILDARVSIRASVQAPGVAAVLDGGVASSLGDLGPRIDALLRMGRDPGGLLRPLTDAGAGLVDLLPEGSLPLGDYARAVEQGARLSAELFGGLDGTPESLLRVFGAPFDQAVRTLDRTLSGFNRVALADAGNLRGLLTMMDGEIPRDPARLVELVLRVLVPLPSDTLRSLRRTLDPVLAGLDGLALPAGRTASAAGRLRAIVDLSATADLSRLDAELAELARVRAQITETLRADLTHLHDGIVRVRPIASLRALAEAAGGLRAGPQGLADLFEEWRGWIRSLREYLETTPVEAIRDFIPHVEAYLDQMEATARREIGGFIDTRVEELIGVVRDLFAQLGLRELRADIRAAFQAAAAKVREAELDRVARSIHQALDQVRQGIGSVDLGERVRAAVESAAETIRTAVDAVADALASVRDAVAALAAQAEGILSAAADALETFAGAIQAIAREIDELGIREAGQEVVDRIAEIRQKAEELLSDTPLPEPMRPLVEQLLAELKGIDLDVVIRRPIDQALERLTLPGGLQARLMEILDRVDETIKNLVPAELIAGIEEELAGALETFRRFDPAALVGELTGFIRRAADEVAALDPTPLLGELSAPFRLALEQFDRLHPARLLQPVIQVYEELWGGLPLPEPSAAAEAGAGALRDLTENVGRTMAAPARALAGEEELVERDPTAPPPEPPTLAQRPGDVIRALGYVPRKLRETLAGLQAGPAGEVVNGVAALTGGLARDLRRLRSVVGGIQVRLERALDDALAPLAPLELAARAAVEARFTAPGVNLSARLDLLASLHPQAIRQDLAAEISVLRERLGEIRTLLESLAAPLDAAATLLAGLGGAADGGLDAILAALDPEPIAAELDALVLSALGILPGLLDEIGPVLERFFARIQGLVRDFHPVVQAQKFLKVLRVLHEELNVLSPRALAGELGEVHAAVRAALAAYDPANFAADFRAILSEIAETLRSLDPAALLGDLDFLGEALRRLEEASPARALEGVGEGLAAVGERLRAANPAVLIESVTALPGRVSQELTETIDAIRREVIALLESIQYVTGSASASVSVSGSIA